MTDLLQLAERAEAATGPDARLNMEISLAVGGAMPSGFEMQYEGTRVPSYTVSIDAAMSLIPQGWGGSIHFSESRQHHTVALGRSYPTNTNTYAESAALALAMTAAALRTRAATPKDMIHEGEG